MKNVSVIIVNWNTKSYIKNCLRSIYQHYPPQTEIIVVDNNSSDGSQTFIKKHFPKVKLIRNPKNYGYAKANNQGAKMARSDLILILNPDTIMLNGTIQNLVSFYQSSPNIGAVIPKLLNSNGSVQYFYNRRLPTLKYQIGSLLYNYTPYKNFKWSKEFFLLDQKFIKNTSIEQASGVCILTSKDTIKKVGGLFDQNLPIFLNDVDFSFRLQKAGLPIILIAKSKLVHIRSSSTNKLNPYTLRQEVILSTLYYIRKNGSLVSYLLAKTSIICLLIALIVTTTLGINRSYLMAPISKRSDSLKRQWQNLKSAILEKRNHPGLIAPTSGS